MNEAHYNNLKAPAPCNFESSASAPSSIFLLDLVLNSTEQQRKINDGLKK